MLPPLELKACSVLWWVNVVWAQFPAGLLGKGAHCPGTEAKLVMKGWGGTRDKQVKQPVFALWQQMWFCVDTEGWGRGMSLLALERSLCACPSLGSS